MSASQEVQTCMIRRWYEYLIGSPVRGDYDRLKVEQFSAAYQANPDLKSLIIEMVADPDVMNRKRLGK